MPTDEVMAGHWFVRDGSFWTCWYKCGTRVPFPSPFPDPAALGPCRPRPWLDGEPAVTIGHAHPHGAGVQPERYDKLPNNYDPQDGRPSPLENECPDCGAGPGERCIDRRRVNGRTLRPHTARRT